MQLLARNHDAISWTLELLSAFKNAQEALNDLTSITIPKSSDQLIITSDGAVKKGVLALYCMSLEKRRL